MKRIAAGLAALAAIALAPAAQAVTTITSVNTDTGPDGSFTTTFSDVGEVAGPGGIFTETLTFTTLAGLLGIRVNTSADDINAQNDTDLTNIFLSGGSIVGQINILPTLSSTDTDEVYRLSALPVTAGEYTLTVQGIPALFNSGFTGQVIFTAAPTSAVPEPATWAMMMLGMGAVGYALRRKRAVEGERRLSLA